MTHRDPPRLPRVLAAVPVLVAVVLVVIGLLLALADHWRRGTALMAIAAGVAALARLALPPRWVGPLAVRSRALDVAFLVLIAAVLAVTSLGVVIPAS